MEQIVDRTKSYCSAQQFSAKISRVTVQHLKGFISEINKHDKRKGYIIKGVPNNS